MPDDRTPIPGRVPGVEEKKKSALPKWAVVLIVVVSCLLTCPCIAAVGVPAFVTYVKRSKTAEARANLELLRARYVATCEAGAEVREAGPLPEAPGSYRQDPGFQADAAFRALGFAPAVPVYYAYGIRAFPNSAALELYAEGDLDDDGVRSRFSIGCVDGCVCVDTIDVTNELE